MSSASRESIRSRNWSPASRSQQVVAGGCGAHRGDHLAQEDRLERLRRLAQIRLLRFALGVCSGGAGCRRSRRRSRLLVQRQHGAGAGQRERGRGGHHGHRITSSAFSAPACFKASRIAARSLGDAPMALIVSTISDKLAPRLISNAGLVCSSICDLAALFDRGLTLAERRRLNDCRRFLHLHGQFSVAHCRRADPHRAIDNDRTGARVNNYFRCGLCGGDGNVLDSGHHHHPLLRRDGCCDAHGDGIVGDRKARNRTGC